MTGGLGRLSKQQLSVAADAVAGVRRALWHLRKGGPGGLRTHLGTKHRRAAEARSRTAANGLVERRALRPDAPRRPNLRVAVILDVFSTVALEVEWNQVPLSLSRWRRDLESGHVDMLFVESAWNGNAGSWRYQLTGSSGVGQPVRDLVAWCRSRQIPTVFWNKEDPTHHADFLEAASLFDHVLTTDSSVVDQYRAELGHDRVGVMTFAAQPAIHNPVRPSSGDHASRDVAFAGMYFAHRHPERRAQMDLLLGAASRVAARTSTTFDIYSRQPPGDARYAFPPPLASHVAGTLTYGQMVETYRSHKVFLNVNTVVNSPTMCARRILEITACGTPVVSTPSPAITAILGADGVVQVEAPEEAEQVIRGLLNSAELRERLVHGAQRRIWSQHTYSHRVDDLVRRTGLDQPLLEERKPAVTVILSTKRPERMELVLDTLAKQEGVDLQIALLAHGWEVDEDEVLGHARARGLDNMILMSADRSVPLGSCLNRLVKAADAPVVAKMDDDDLYGPSYLRDQVNALGFSGAEVVGKQAHYVHLAMTGATALRHSDREHRFTDLVMGPTIVARTETARSTPFAALQRGEDTGFLRAVAAAGGRIYSADRFNFVQVRGSTDHTWNVSDWEILASSQVQVFGPPLAHALA